VLLLDVVERLSGCGQQWQHLVELALAVLAQHVRVLLLHVAFLLLLFADLLLSVGFLLLLLQRDEHLAVLLGFLDQQRLQLLELLLHVLDDLLGLKDLRDARVVPLDLDVVVLVAGVGQLLEGLQ